MYIDSKKQTERERLLNKHNEKLTNQKFDNGLFFLNVI